MTLHRITSASPTPLTLHKPNSHKSSKVNTNPPYNLVSAIRSRQKHQSYQAVNVPAIAIEKENSRNNDTMVRAIR